MKKAIIFDFDGPILDSFRDQFEWFRHLCSLKGKTFPYSSPEEMRGDYREPVIPEMYHRLGFDWQRERDYIWQEFNAYKARAQIPLVEGIADVVEKLNRKGMVLAIASSNTREGVTRHLRENGLQSYFHTIIVQDDLPVINGDRPIKPNPAILLIALERLGLSPQETVYVGDHPVDIIAARRVAEHRGEPVPIIAVTYGYAPREHLAALRPNFLADRPEEIVRITEKM